jgi:hypothetical protein
VKLKTLDIRGTTFDVEVDSLGSFSAVLDGESITAITLVALKEKLDKLTAKPSPVLSVEFYVEYENRLRKGTITKIHAANGNALVTWDDGGRTQMSSYEQSYHEYLNLPTPQKVKQARELLKALDAATREWTKFREQHPADLRRRVEKARAENQGGVK